MTYILVSGGADDVPLRAMSETYSRRNSELLALELLHGGLHIRRARADAIQRGA
jgi:hypothetical protein